MKLYTVEFTATVEVEALTEEEAINAAVDMVGRSPLGYGDASVVGVEEVEDDEEEEA
jgi:hypothetical protein